MKTKSTNPQQAAARPASGRTLLRTAASAAALAASLTATLPAHALPIVGERERRR